MNTKHTPGPWYQRPNDTEMPTQAYIRSIGSDELIATVYTEIDARLIAATPDLLAAGIAILEELNARIAIAPATAKPVFNGIAELHAAIAKATGGNDEISQLNLPKINTQPKM